MDSWVTKCNCGERIVAGSQDAVLRLGAEHMRVCREHIPTIKLVSSPHSPTPFDPRRYTVLA